MADGNTGGYEIPLHKKSEEEATPTQQTGGYEIPTFEKSGIYDHKAMRQYRDNMSSYKAELQDVQYKAALDAVRDEESFISRLKEKLANGEDVQLELDRAIRNRGSLTTAEKAEKDAHSNRMFSAITSPTEKYAFEKAEEKKRQLAEDYTPLQARDVLRSEGLRGFSAALSLTGSADEAFRLTLERVPDVESKIRIYSAMLQIPEDVVRDNFKEVESKALFLDHKKLMANKENLLKYISDPRNMAIAKDSLKHLAYIESLLVSRYGGFLDRSLTAVDTTLRDMSSSITNFDAMQSAMAGEFFDGLAWVAGGGEIGSNSTSKFFELASDFGGATEEVYLQRAKEYQEQTARLTDEVDGVERYIHDMTGGLAQIFAFMGSGVLSPAVATYSMIAMEGGHIYGDLRDQDVSVLRAAFPAIVGGGINGLLEKAQIKSAGKAIGLVKGRSPIRDVLMAAVENQIQETVQNVVSETSLIVGEAAVKDQTAPEIGNRLGSSLREGAYEGLVAAGSMLIIGTPSLYRGFKRSKTSETMRAKLKAIEKVVADTDMAERNPKDMEDFLVAQGIDGKGDGEIEVRHVEAYLQSLPEPQAKLLKQQLLEKLDISEEAYSKAVEDDLEIGFKISKWLAHVSNTDLGNAVFDNLAFGEMYSVADTKILRDKLEKDITAFSDILSEYMSKDKPLPKEIAKFREDLLKAGGYSSASDVDAIISLIMAWGSRFAEEAGITLEEYSAQTNPVFIFNKAGVRMGTAEEVLESEFGLSPDEIAAFKAEDDMRSKREKLSNQLEDGIGHAKYDYIEGAYIYPDGTRIVGTRGKRRVEDADGNTIIERDKMSVKEAKQAYADYVRENIEGELSAIDNDLRSIFDGGQQQQAVSSEQAMSVEQAYEEISALEDQVSELDRKIKETTDKDERSTLKGEKQKIYDRIRDLVIPIQSELARIAGQPVTQDNNEARFNAATLLFKSLKKGDVIKYEDDLVTVVNTTYGKHVTVKMEDGKVFPIDGAGMFLADSAGNVDVKIEDRSTADGTFFQRQPARFISAVSTSTDETLIDGDLVPDKESALHMPDGIKDREKKTVIEAYEKNINIMRGAAWYKPQKENETLEESYENIINHMVKNLLYIHDAYPEEARERAKLWYDGARHIAEKWAEKYNVTEAQVAGIIAVLSPQNEWFNNMSLAERVLDILTEQQNTPMSKEMASNKHPSEKGRTLYSDSKRSDNKTTFLKEVKGKMLSQLETIKQKALWLRSYDENHLPKQKRIVTPEGDFVDFKLNDDGSRAKSSWKTMGTIEKAISIFEDGSPENISYQLGAKHKVRNFYNNIFDPASPLNTTVDTHAVAADELMPISAKSPQAGYNFGTEKGSGKSIANGMFGTYFIHYEAIKKAAEMRGVLPREMQSITWEAVRGLFTEDYKDKDGKNLAKITKIWENYSEGKITHEEAIEEIFKDAEGIKLPDWLERDGQEGSDNSTHVTSWPSTYKEDVHGTSIDRRGRRDVKSRITSGSSRVSDGQVDVWSTPQQEISSADTSINKIKTPATIGVTEKGDKKPLYKKYVEPALGKINADIGGGKHDNVTKFLKKKGTTNLIYDPFNQTKEHNDAVVEQIKDGQADTATINNVLNVIKEAENRLNVIAQAANAIKKDGTAFFLIFEGSKDNQKGGARVTQEVKHKDGTVTPSTWQEYRKAETYMDEIKSKFRSVERKGNLIIAKDPIKEGDINPQTFFQSNVNEKDAMGFFSSLKNAAMDLKQNKGSAEQMTNMIQKGTNEEERYWSGVEEFIEGRAKENGGKITKAEIVEFLEQGGVQIVERNTEANDKTFINPEFEGKDEEALRLILTDLKGEIPLHRNVMKQRLKDANPLLRYEMIEHALSKLIDTSYRDNAMELVGAQSVEPNGLSLNETAKEMFGVEFRDLSTTTQEDKVKGAVFGDRQVTLTEEQAKKVDAEAKQLKRKQLEVNKIVEELNERTKSLDTRHDFYTLNKGKGGTNYREVKLILPVPPTVIKSGVIHRPDTFVRRSHFDEENIIVHLRIKDYIDTDGNRVMVIQEIQSDWHADARKERTREIDRYLEAWKTDRDDKESLKRIEAKVPSDFGYRKAKKDLVVEELEDGIETDFVNKDDEFFNDWRWVVRNKVTGKIISQGAEEHARKVVQDKIKDDHSGRKVPDAPFKGNAYAELAIKRALTMAIEGGYDKLAWTTGEQQAEFYSGLEEQVKWLEYTDNGNGTYAIEAYNFSEDLVFNEQNVTLERIENLAGKDVAKRILDGEGKIGSTALGDNFGELRGDNLKFGGAGMRVYYDKVVRNLFRKVLKDQKIDKNLKVGSTDVVVGKPSKAEEPDMVGDRHIGIDPERGLSALYHEDLDQWDIFTDDVVGVHVLTVDDSDHTVSKEDALKLGYEHLEEDIEGWVAYDPSGGDQRLYLTREEAVADKDDLFKNTGRKTIIAPVLKLAEEDIAEGDTAPLTFAEEVEYQKLVYRDLLNDDLVGKESVRFEELRQQDQAYKAQKKEQGEALTVHSIDLTDTMKQKVVDRGFTLFQEGNVEDTNRGMIQFFDKETIITKFKNGDASTVLHELGHMFLKQMQGLITNGQASPEMVEHYNKLLSWAGVTYEESISVDENGNTTQVAIDFHENVMDAWEAYLMKGKAPSVELTGAFNKFNTWLTGIYKYVKTVLKGKELTDEVRDVFDFMLASENEIKEAESYYNSSRLTSELFDEEHKKDKKSARARKRLADAKRKAEEEKEKAIYERMQQLVSIWEEMGGRKLMRKEATEHISSLRQYKALADIISGGGFDPLSSGLNDGDVSLLKRVHGNNLVSEGSSLDLDAIAAEYGYTSGRVMLGALVGELALDEAIDKEFNVNLGLKLQAFREIAQEVEEVPSDEVIHSDANLDVMLADLALIELKLGRKKKDRLIAAEKKGIKDAAYNALRTLRKLRDVINYAKWSRREALFSDRAFEAAERGDWDEAYAAKQKQIHYFAIVQAAFKIREKASKFDRWVKSKDFKKTGGISEGHLKAINDIVSTWNLNRARRVEGLSDDVLFVPKTGLHKNDEGLSGLLPQYADMLPDWMLKKFIPEDYRNFKDLSLEQVENIETALKFLIDQGRNEVKVLKQLGVDNINELADISIKNMEARPNFKVSDVRKLLGNIMSKVKEAGAYLKIPEFIMEEADGNPMIKGEPMGILHKLWHIVRQKDADYENIIGDLLNGDEDKGIVAIKASASILERNRKDYEAKAGGKTFLIDGLPVPQAIKDMYGIHSWDYHMVVSIALNLGNDANIHALQASEYAFTDEQLDIVRSFFTAEAWDAIQDIWNTLNTLYEPLKKAHAETAYTKLKKEGAIEFVVKTSDGQVKTMKGGYYPLVFDPKISPLQAADDEHRSAMDKARAEGVHRSSARPSAGSTNERIRDDETGEALSKRPPLLNLSVIHMHIKDTVRYITHARVMQEIDALTKHPEWKAMFINKFGYDKWVQLRKSLNYIARPERRVEGFFNKALDYGRNLFGIDVLGLKATTGVKQRLSEINAISAMNKAGNDDGLKYLALGHSKVSMRGNLIGQQSEDTLDFVHSRSAIVKARAQGNYDREVRDFMGSIKPFGGTITIQGREISYKDMQSFAFWWVRANDYAAIYPVWLGAYYQALETHLNGIDKLLTPEGGVQEDLQGEAEKLAAQYADTILAMSQPASSPADLPSLLRDEGFIRMLTSFMTWTIKAGNRSMWFGSAVKSGDIGKKDFAKHFVLEWWLPALSQMAIPALLYNDDDKPEWWEFFANPVYDSISWIPLLSQGLSGVRYGVSGLPALEGINQTFKAGKQLSKFEFAKGLDNTMKAVFFWAGAPLDNPFRDAVKYYDRITGE